jgi:hypothetical protein
MPGHPAVRGAMEPVSQPSTTPSRPSQVTVAAWMIMVGSVFVVLMVWDRIAGLHSLESRQALQSVLDDPGVKGTGLQVDDLMLLVRVLGMVAAGCSATRRSSAAGTRARC